MKLDFCFSGWVRDAEVTEVTVVETGEKIALDGRDKQEVLSNLDKGIWVLSFTDAYDNSNDTECDIFDFASEGIDIEVDDDDTFEVKVQLDDKLRLTVNVDSLVGDAFADGIERLANLISDFDDGDPSVNDLIAKMKSLYGLEHGHDELLRDAQLMFDQGYLEIVEDENDDDE